MNTSSAVFIVLYSLIDKKTKQKNRKNKYIKRRSSVPSNLKIISDIILTDLNLSTFIAYYPKILNFSSIYRVVK